MDTVNRIKPFSYHLLWTDMNRNLLAYGAVNIVLVLLDIMEQYPESVSALISLLKVSIWETFPNLS